MSSMFGVFNRARQPLPELSLERKHKKLIAIPNRPLVAQNAATPSLANLGHDLIVMVLQVLQTAHPASMGSVKQVSSNFCHAADYIACNAIQLDLSLSASVTISERLLRLEQRGLCAAVRSIEVSAIDDERPSAPSPGDDDSSIRGQDNLQPLDLLHRLLPSMTGLTDLHWPSEKLSPGTLAVIKNLSVRLHVKTNFYGSSSLDRLVDCHNLYSLTVHQQYSNAEDCLKITGPLKAVLLSSSNLRKLSLDISQPRSGCMVYSKPTQYCGMGLTNGERPPALQSLSIVSYPFGTNAEDVSAHGVFGRVHAFSHGYPGRETEQDYWITNFDWSRLRHLDVNDAKLALGLVSKLPKLEAVVLKHVHSTDAIKQFYLEVATSLKTIEVQKLESIGLAGILRHGLALRKLQLHQDEGCNKTWKDEAVDNASLAKIRDECSLIEELHLDIGRSGAWPYDILDTVAGFSRLSELTIWFELGMRKGEGLVTPKVTFSVVEEIFKYLRERWPTLPSKLRELHVYSGSPPGIGHGYPSPMAFWPQYNSMHFRCRLSERDDEAARGVFTTDCPELGKLANEYLRGQRETFKPREGYAYMYDAERIDVARNGPKSRDDWKAHY